ncbi:MAG: hypothetical protein KA175_00860 [Flavobacteriales bacterium]|nr:hypothetical protein [Flavobacteriales bacterium]MBP6696133.1 hypothetical protein [Flavobacteriales bacterium]
MAKPRPLLPKILKSHPRLHEELFRFTEPDVRERALKNLDSLTLGERTRLEDRARYITLTRIIHRPRVDNTCRGKFIYTEHGANRAVSKIWKAGRGRMRIYRCPICEGFHLTHQANLFAKDPD